ncbi:hypothetical protein CPAR01_01522 [Colletotrichum paranaense]|uniref:DUF924-domain-containing protein n=1 Tax=Colletotrichum paranaense TaxID=1914294 RepID=A0ABQ9T720_9PEZI|nr:uncharacterized protein CPAR01_01522 [Colletotrichum paranaense]KAK1547555.1 hypothetical protein CPAR01_01522 [Colletotrichum paranaense]
MAGFTSTLPRTLLSPSLYTHVHNVWFQGVAPHAKIASREAMTRWFGQGSPEDRRAFDDTCTKEFAAALESIGPEKFPLPPSNSFSEESAAAEYIAGPLMQSINTSDGETKSMQTLALILLLDQIPRNIFRTRQAVIYTHYDRLAGAVLRSLMSAESRPDMHPSLRLAPARHHETYIKVASEILEFEKRHKHLIERFGRYPHRNAQLGRSMTKEEEEHLRSGGEHFGTAV